MGEKLYLSGRGKNVLWESVVDQIRFQAQNYEVDKIHIIEAANDDLTKYDYKTSVNRHMDFQPMIQRPEDFYYTGEDVIPGTGKTVNIDPTVIDSAVINSPEEADALVGDPVLIDTDGYVFQRRNGEWFMAGAAFGSIEFTGCFPARKMVIG